jgi:hypothetical protein
VTSHTSKTGSSAADRIVLRKTWTAVSHSLWSPTQAFSIILGGGTRTLAIGRAVRDHVLRGRTPGASEQQAYVFIEAVTAFLGTMLAGVTRALLLGRVLFGSPPRCLLLGKNRQCARSRYTGNPLHRAHVAGVAQHISEHLDRWSLQPHSCLPLLFCFRHYLETIALTRAIEPLSCTRPGYTTGAHDYFSRLSLR